MKYLLLILIILSACVDVNIPQAEYSYELEIEYKNGDQKKQKINLLSRTVPEFIFNPKDRENCLVVFTDEAQKTIACDIRHYFIAEEKIIHHKQNEQSKSSRLH
jgi:hypothetical protein